MSGEEVEVEGRHGHALFIAAHIGHEVAAIVQRFQEASAPVVQLTRRAITGGLDLSYEEAVSHAEDVYLNQLLATQDVEEGLRAVSEKRKPAWKDR